MGKMDKLTSAIDSADLPGIINGLYPDAQIPPKGGLGIAVWRGETHPSFSVFRRGGVWFWKDHATGETGNTYGFLTAIAGMSAREAAEYLTGERAKPVARQAKRETPPAKRYTGPSTHTTQQMRAAYRELHQLGPNADMRRRGLDRDTALKYYLGRQGEDVLIPLFRAGKLYAVKRRVANAQNGKYRYLDSGSGSPPLILEGHNGKAILVEGELNAIVAHAALSGAYTVVGMPGANQALSSEVMGLSDEWYIHTDADRAGRQAKVDWARALHQTGKTVYMMPFLPNRHPQTGKPADWCDLNAAGELAFQLERSIPASKRLAKSATPKLMKIIYMLKLQGIESAYRSSASLGVSRQTIEKAYHALPAVDVPNVGAAIGVGPGVIALSDWRELDAVGKVIRAQYTIAQLAEAMKTSRQNIYNLIKRSYLLRIVNGIVTVVNNWRQLLFLVLKLARLKLKTWRRRIIMRYIQMWAGFMRRITGGSSP